MATTLNIKDLGIRQASSRHLGNYYLCADKSNIYAFEILDYIDYTPNTLKRIGCMKNDGNTTWDEAHDKLIGKLEAPDFTKVIAQ